MSSGNRVGLHPLVRRFDIPRLDQTIRQRISRAIKSKLETHPEIYGMPLRKSLKQRWKLRVGDYRIIYRIMGKEVRITAIGHRSEIYKMAEERE